MKPPLPIKTRNLILDEFKKCQRSPILKSKTELTNKNKTKNKMEKTATQLLGHNYVYHYNEFENKWYCISRDSYLNYWSKTMKDNDNWTSGVDVEDAAAKMLKKLK